MSSMINELLSELMGSGAGADLLKAVQEKGLSAEQAKGAVTATAEGAVQHAGEGGLASLAQSMLGGNGGGLASLAGSLLGGAAPTGGDATSTMATAVAGFVAQKTGIQPATAQAVVALVLPRVMELIRGKVATAPPQANVASALGGLFK